MSTSYKNQAVLDIPPDFKTLDLGQLDDFAFDPLGLGKAVPWKPTALPKRNVRYPFLFADREASKIFRVFIEQHRGRLTGFWLPLYCNDYPLLEDVAEGQTELVIEKIGLAEKWEFGTQFRHIALLTRAGKLECYGLTGVTVDGGTEILTLDEPLISALVAAETVCCGLMFARCAEDEIEYSYLNDITCRAEVNFIELPTETLTPDFGDGPAGAVHEGSIPFYLYRISRGGFAWYFTNWPLDVETTDGRIWIAADIGHGEVESGLDLIAESLSLTLATRDSENPLRALLDRDVVNVTDIQIFESDLDSLEYDSDAPVYTGRVEEARFEEQGVISLTIGSILRIAEQEAPRIQLQRPCNHRVFDALCGLNEADFTTSGPLTAVSREPAYVEAAEFGAKATLESDPNWFALGKVTIGTQTRLCTGQDGDRLYLNAPFKDVSAGDVVNASAGCDKRIGTCQTKFDNVERHLGFGYIPNKNPQFEALSTPKPSGGKKA